MILALDHLKFAIDKHQILWAWDLSMAISSDLRLRLCICCIYCDGCGSNDSIYYCIPGTFGSDLILGVLVIQL